HRRPVLVPNAVGLIERDDDVVLRVLRGGRDLFHGSLEDRQVVPGAVVVLVSRPLGAGVGPVRVRVLYVHEEVAAGSGKEVLLDLERVAAGVLGAVRRLLRHVGDAGAVEDGLTRYILVAEAVQASRGAASEGAGASREIDSDRVGGRGRVRRDSCDGA